MKTPIKAFLLVLLSPVIFLTSEAKTYWGKDTLKANPNKQYKSFLIITKDCKHCQDKFKITILINDNVYLDTVAKDSMIINIPTAQPDDIITIKKYKFYTLTWNCHGWTHNREYNFKIKNNHIVRLKSISKVRSNYPHKKGHANYDM